MTTLKARVGGVWVDVGGGGGGTDEVWIGTDPPAGTTQELWFDTDEPNLTDPDTARWNSAWGVVASAPINTTSPLALGATSVTVASISFTTVAGRRYVVHGNVRTVESLTGAPGVTIFTCSGIPGDTSFSDHYQRTDTAANGYGGGAANEWRFDGTGAVATLLFRAAMSAGTGQLHGQGGSSSHFWCEDVGPVAMASAPPAQPASAWAALPLGSGWTADTNDVPQYRLLGDVVQLRGMPRNAAANSTLPGALPVGFRPPTGRAPGFAVPNAAGAHAVVWVYSSGMIQLGATTAAVQLDGIQFSVTP